jgi:hypothetical protein
MKPSFRILWCLLLLLSAPAALAAGEVLDKPDLLLLGGGDVAAFLRMSDGRLIVGGQFERVGNDAVRNLVRLNADGSVDTDWRPEPNGSVRSLALSPSGELYVAGEFTMIAGGARSHLAKIGTGTQATLVTAFQASLPNDRPFVSPIRLVGNDLYVAVASFDSGSSLRRLDATTGARDLQFLVETPGFVLIRDLLALPGDTAMVVAGDFTQLNAIPRNGLARVSMLDGSVDPVWNPAPTRGAQPGRVRALISDGPDHLIVGGEFSQIGGITQSAYARVSLSGTGLAAALPTVVIASQPAAAPRVAGLARFPDGDLLVAGAFTQIGGEPVPAGVARLTDSGAVRTGWGTDAPLGYVGTSAVQLGVDADGNALIPRFPYGERRANLQRLSEADGSAVAPIHASGFASRGVINHLARHPTDGRVAAAGLVLEAEAIPGLGLLVLDGDRELDAIWRSELADDVSAISVSSSSGIGGLLRAALRFDAAGMLLGGFVFDLEGGSGAGIRRLDPGSGASLTWQPVASFVNPAYTGGHSALSSDHVYLAGSFSVTVPGVGLFQNLARFDIDSGLLDTSWRPQVTGVPHQIELSGGFLVLAAAGATDVNGLVVNGLARIALDGNGRADPDWRPISGTATRVGRFAIDEDDSWLYAAGTLNVSSPLLIRYALASGSVDAAWTPLAGRGGTLTAMALASDGSVAIAGSLNLRCNGQATALARVQPGGRIDPAFAAQLQLASSGTPGAQPTILALEHGDDGALLVGGEFTAINGVTRTGLAALGTGPTVFTDGYGDPGCIR